MSHQPLTLVPRPEANGSGSQQLQHMLAVVGGVADQSLAAKVNDEVQHF